MHLASKTLLLHMH